MQEASTRHIRGRANRMLMRQHSGGRSVHRQYPRDERKMDYWVMETRGGFRKEVIQEAAGPRRLGSSQYYTELT